VITIKRVYDAVGPTTARISPAVGLHGRDDDLILRTAVGSLNSRTQMCR
jgi:hypothetical protein